jgi:glutaredoxin-like YruB-family protein
LINYATIIMNLARVTSHSDFLNKSGGNGKSLLLLYRKGSEQSECAFLNLLLAMESSPEMNVFTADVTEVRDIHTSYGVTSVPSLLVFDDSRLTGVIKGCQESDYYRALTENSLFRGQAAAGEKAANKVTVYSTPTCSWCNTLKSWLKQQGIPYTDVDVSSDQRAAEDLVRRTGQQGVPQTDINGEIVVGFNQPKLKELLGIR